MKKIIFIIAIALNLTAFATQIIEHQERNLLCRAVENVLEVEKIDMALNRSKCLSNEMVTSETISDGEKIVSEILEFRSPYSRSFNLVCELKYQGVPDLENVVSGSVRCF